MSTSSSTGPVSQQYAAAATVPLIKSPSLWLPKPVELPNDIHPLPEDITAYFVYPFNLETHVLAQQPSPHQAISERRAKNAAVLLQREQEEEQKERDTLHRLAPGYNPTSLLLPASAIKLSLSGQAMAPTTAPAPVPEPETKPMSDMDMLSSLNDGQMGPGGGDDGWDQLDDVNAELAALDPR